MSSLPPGVTDAMIDDHVNGPMCECGHYAAEHYWDEQDEYPLEKLSRHYLFDTYHAEGLLRDADGEVVLACDIVDCGCDKFEDGF